MRTEPPAHEVRELVVRVLERLDIDVGSPWDMDETILIDDGRYTARTYKINGYMAMWMLSIGIVQFYDAEGNMLCTVNLFEELDTQRIAA